MNRATAAEIRAALDIGEGTSGNRSRTIDVTTIGARSGRPRRIEIWFWQVGGHWYLSSEPGPRSWFANLSAHPSFTIHLTNGVHADVPARAEVVTDPTTRRRVLPEIMRQSGMYATNDPEPWVADSPLVEVIPEPGAD